MREANADNNLSVVQSQVFDKATKFEELDIKNIIYHEPKIQSNSSNKYQDLQAESLTPFETLHLLMTSIEERGNSNIEFCEKIYEEYFDHRMYLIEQYLDCAGRIMDGYGV